MASLTLENCGKILVDDPRISQLINPKRIQNMMQRSKAKLMIKEAYIISIFVHRLSNNIYRICQLGIGMKDIHNH